MHDAAHVATAGQHNGAGSAHTRARLPCNVLPQGTSAATARRVALLTRPFASGAALRKMHRDICDVN